MTNTGNTGNIYYSIKKEKDEMRAAASERRRAMTKEEREARDAKICSVMQSLVSYRYANVILMYAPLEYEIDIMPIAKAALEKGKLVAFPRCNVENKTMNYHIVTNLDDLKPDAYGIREPDPSLPIYTPEDYRGSSLCLVPGVLYDKAGYRIGYGKGYYDRYLSSFGGCSIGIVYSDFILDTVPRGRFDVNVNILLTEKGVRMISEA